MVCRGEAAAASVEGQFGQSVTQLGGERPADGQSDFAGVVKGLADDAGLHIFDDAHHIIHHHIGEAVGNFLLDEPFLLHSMVDGIGCRLAVGHDESAGAQQDTAKIADDHHEDIGEFPAVDLSQDRLAGSAARFAVIVGSELVAFMSQHISPADVSCVEVFLAVLGHNLFHLVNTLHVVGKGEEFTTLFRNRSLANGLFGYRFVGIHEYGIN